LSNRIQNIFQFFWSFLGQPSCRAPGNYL
jgi:hypothetical protein